MLGYEGWNPPSYSAMDARTVIFGVTPVQAASDAKRGPGVWLASSNGLTVGSDYNGFETTVDIPNVFHGNMTSNTFEFHVWNPPPDKDGTYRLAVSNKEGTSTAYYVDIELLSSDKVKFHKRIELGLQKGEEVLIPLRITSNPATGELTLVTEEPKPAYTVAFGIEPPIAGFMPEVFLDDKLLAPLSEGTYKVLAFEKGTKHTIKLNPTVFRFENGTQIPLQPPTWEFTEGGEKIFQYTSRTPSTPQSQIMDYLPYIGVAAVVIVAVFALVRRRRKPAEAKTIKISEEAQPRYCINCGAKISKETKYCIECGREQD